MKDVNNMNKKIFAYIGVITTKGTAKRVRLTEFELSSRTRRGVQVIREVKSNPYIVLTTFIDDSKNYIGLRNGDINIVKFTEFPIADRYSTGTSISKHELTDAFVVASLSKPEEHQEKLVDVEEVVKEEKIIPKKGQISLQEIDDRLMTIDDFLGDIDKGIE